MNTSSYGRVVSSALLTRTLKRLRHASGQQHKQVAEALEWSISKLIRIESSSAQISRTDLETLLRYYGVTGQEQVDELTVWAQESRLPGWWESFRIQDEAFERYVAYEAAAASIRMAQELLVPGILQTEEYARLISSTYSSPDDVDSVVRLRLARQEAVFARKPEQHHILDEAVLRRRVGDTMPGQLRHLAELAARPEIIIRVIPFGAGPHFGMKGPFVLLGFDVPLGNILFLESGRRSDLIICEEETYPDQILPGVSEAAEAIAAFEDGFSELNRIALDESDSTALIEQIGRESALLFPRYLGSIAGWPATGREESKRADHLRSGRRCRRLHLPHRRATCPRPHQHPATLPEGVQAFIVLDWKTIASSATKSSTLAAASAPTWLRDDKSHPERLRQVFRRAGGLAVRGDCTQKPMVPRL